MLTVQTFVNYPVISNCYILYDKEKGNECVVVDPGSKSEDKLFEFVEQEDLHPTHIILTHEHFDHCWGVNQLVDRYHIPIVCSEICADAIKYEKRNCSVFYDNKEAFTIKSETISVESIRNILVFQGNKLKFFNTPGHTDASISFKVGQFLFTGDTLIKEERTVTKLPTGSVFKLRESMSAYYSMQGEGSFVCPGHGELFKLDGYDLNKLIN